MRLILLLLLIIPIEAFSQTKGFISIGGDWNSGNFQSIGLTLRSELKKDSGNYQWAVSPTYRWSEQSKVGGGQLNLYENELYLTGNLTKSLAKSWKVIGFSENEKSYLRKIDLRSAAGLGIGVDLFNNGGFRISVSELILPEYYWSSLNTDLNNFNVRGSTRLKLEINGKLFKFSSINLVQPAIYSSRQVSFADNLNIRSNSSISIKIKDRYETGILHTLTYQGYPYYINKTIVPMQQGASIFFKCIL
jgi:hypothetical protein